MNIAHPDNNNSVPNSINIYIYIQLEDREGSSSIYSNQEPVKTFLFAQKSSPTSRTGTIVYYRHLYISLSLFFYFFSFLRSIESHSAIYVRIDDFDPTPPPSDTPVGPLWPAIKKRSSTQDNVYRIELDKREKEGEEKDAVWCWLEEIKNSRDRSIQTGPFIHLQGEIELMGDRTFSSLLCGER
jgi:hypothetical protein